MPARCASRARMTFGRRFRFHQSLPDSRCARLFTLNFWIESREVPCSLDYFLYITLL